MKPIINPIAQICLCCTAPALLISRADLASGLAACSVSGRLYRSTGQRYSPTTLPPLDERPDYYDDVMHMPCFTGYA
jgi:hypothetical protein